MKDYYKILEISENASEEVVHMAYKALVKNITRTKTIKAKIQKIKW